MMNLDTNRLLAIAALIAAILSFFVAGPLIAIAVILLALAMLV
jgi:uncharacterized membrane protein